MTDADEDFAPPPHSRFRWLRRLAKAFFGVLAVVLLLAFVSRWQLGRVGQRQLDATVQRVDAQDPNWKLDPIFAEHNNADGANAGAAAAVPDLAERVPKEFGQWQQTPEGSDWWNLKEPNRLPAQGVIDAARKQAPGTLLARTESVRLREKRPGLFPITIGPNPLATTLPHLDKCSTVSRLLRYDAALAALDKNPNRGVSAARSSLTVARAVGNEPLLVSQMFRMSLTSTAAQTAMHVLAWGEPIEGLAELQSELLAEADVPWFRVGMRGERAVLDKLFRGLEDGTIGENEWLALNHTKELEAAHIAAFRAYRPLLPGDHAKAIELATKYIEVTTLPHHEQLPAFIRIETPKGPPEEIRYILTRLLLPACARTAEVGLRTRTEVLAAATCVACERFRLKHKRWPNDLAELTPEFISAVPLNPFDGKPLSYRVLPDRIAVFGFSTQSRLSPNLWAASDFRDGDAPGSGYGHRVWNPDQRGLPALENKAP